jgi:hypothetical protein
LPATAVGVPGVPGAENTRPAEALEADDVPPTFVAVAVKVYVLPPERPVTSHDVAGEVTVQVAPPGEAVTR